VSRKRMGFLTAFGAVFALLVVFSPLASTHPSGLSIAVNFGADEPLGNRSDVLGEAGVLGTENWNNLDGAVGGPEPLQSDEGGVVNDTEVMIEWQSNNTWASTGRGEENNTAEPGNDRNLMTGYLDTGGGGVTSTVTVTGLDDILEPDQEFTVYVYMNGGVTGRGGDYQIGDQTTPVTDEVPFDGTYNRGENYIVFTGLKGSEFTLTATRTMGAVPRAPLNGMEIVVGGEVDLHVPIREITPETSAEICGPGGRGPVTVKISQTLPPGADAGEQVTVVEEARGEFGKSAVTAKNGGTVEDIFPTGISEAGFVNAWLLLGPLGQDGGAAPGEDVIRLDYLTDGDQIEELTVAPKAGDTVQTDFNGTAASTGILGPEALNPGGVPTWNALVLPGANTINYNTYFGGAVNNSMMYAVTYIRVEDDIDVNLCIGSDDSVQVLVDGDEVLINNISRGAGADTQCQDSVLISPLTAGLHQIMVKVFQGAGGNGFRLGIMDPATGEPAEGITVCLDPDQEPCSWDPVGARITWNVPRGDLVNGVEYTVDVIEGRIGFKGTVGDELITGSNSVNLVCDARVTEVACAMNAGGGADVTWTNHPAADTGVEISILVNDTEVMKVPGTSESATVAAGDLEAGVNRICVVNSSGFPTCCAVIKDAIDVSDLVGGGDGAGTSDPEVVGINADTGMLEIAHLNAGIPNTGDNPQAVDSAEAPFVNAVFILDTAEMVINTEEVAFTFSDLDTWGNTYNHILKNATHDVDKNITDIWAGGRNDWARCVAIHAAAGITFDLEALRAEYGELGTFSCFAGVDQCVSAQLSHHVILSDDTEVIDSVILTAMTSNTGEAVEVDIPQEAAFLTLAVGADDGGIGCDHGVFANPVITLGGGGPGGPKFKRGDVNVDGGLNIADAISLLGHLFGGQPDPACKKAADANDDGNLNIADAITILGHLFGGAGPLPEPFEKCGEDSTEDTLNCLSFPPCGTK